MTEPNNEEKISWEKATEEKFQKLLEQIPHMIRGIAEVRVLKRAESIVREGQRSVIMEKDMVDAFFAEVPGGFLGLMKQGMNDIGVDYKKYGHE